MESCLERDRILLFGFLKYQKLVGKGARNKLRTSLIALFNKYLSSTPLTSNSVSRQNTGIMGFQVLCVTPLFSQKKGRTAPLSKHMS